MEERDCRINNEVEEGHTILIKQVSNPHRAYKS